MDRDVQVEEKECADEPADVFAKRICKTLSEMQKMHIQPDIAGLARDVTPDPLGNHGTNSRAALEVPSRVPESVRH
jgi:hypothetical protein